MWILLVIQLTAASATARSAIPTLYSGVAFQEFTSLESCEKARVHLIRSSALVPEGVALDNVRSGVLSATCLQK